MAGDINVGEVLILGRPPKGARLPPIIHEYGPSVRIGLTGTNADEPTIEFGPLDIENFSFSERMGREAFLLRQSPRYRERKAMRPLNGQSWRSRPPLFFKRTPEDESPPSTVGGPSRAPASKPNRLAGPIAVSVIVVSGPTPDLKFTADELADITADVQNGLSWLGKQSPAEDVTWHREETHLTVAAKNTLTGSDEDLEAPWRDAALNQLRLAPGYSGVSRHLRELRNKHKVGLAFCAFFTKYKLSHFAYAYEGRRTIFMEYEADEWVRENTDRVFAHETCHIFGAPDEYDDCACHDHHGPDLVPNGNCIYCTGVTRELCIMDSNDWKMCRFTPHHLGFSKLAKFVP
jgi:hypothetical protein